MFGALDAREAHDIFWATPVDNLYVWTAVYHRYREIQKAAVDALMAEAAATWKAAEAAEGVPV